jgi:hypothetical protein
VDSCELGNIVQVPQNVGKFLSSRSTGDFSRRTQLHAVSYLLEYDAI